VLLESAALTTLAKPLAGAVVSAASRVMTTAFADQKRRRMVEEAVERAAIEGLSATVSAYPSAAAEGFDLSSLASPAVAMLLSNYLTLVDEPSPAELASAWIPLVATDNGGIRIQNLAEVFLPAFEHSLMNSVVLRDHFLQRATIHAPAQRVFVDYLEWLERRTKKIDTRGLSEEPAELELERTFFGVTVVEDRSFAFADRPITTAELAAIRNELLEAGLAGWEVEQRLEDERLEAGGHQFGLASDLGSHLVHTNRVVVLGDPGAGKTTLLRFLARKHAVANRAGFTRLSDGLGLALFPILVRVAEFVESDDWGRTPFFDYLCSSSASHGCPNETATHELLAQRLKSGNCIIFIDGLDEVPLASDRQRVAAKIVEFCDDYCPVDGTNRVVLSSRVAGYRVSPLPSSFRHLRLQPLENGRILEFSRRWLLALEHSLSPDLPYEQHDERIEGILSELSSALDAQPRLRSLAGSPLLLAMILLRIRVGGRLPLRRAQIYGQVATALARTWRSLALPAGVELPDERDVLPLLARIGSWAHENSPTGLISEAQMELLLDEEGVDRSFLTVLREHVGIIAQRAPERYGFVHRTFQEFFAGYCLVDMSQADRTQWIRQRVHAPQWEEPILLGLGWISESQPRLVKALLKEAIWPGWVASDGSLLDRVMGLRMVAFLRCLGDDLPADDDQVLHALQRLRAAQRGESPFVDWGYRAGGFSAIGGTRAGHIVARAIADGTLGRSDPLEVMLLASVGVTDQAVISRLAEMIRTGSSSLADDAAGGLGGLVRNSPLAASAVVELLSDDSVGIDIKVDLLDNVSIPGANLNLLDAITKLVQSGVGDEWARRRLFEGLRRLYGSRAEVHRILVAVVNDDNEAPESRASVLELLASFRIERDTLCDVAVSLAERDDVPWEVRLQAAQCLFELDRVGVERSRLVRGRLKDRSPGDILLLVAEGPAYEGALDGPLGVLDDRNLAEILREWTAERLASLDRQAPELKDVFENLVGSKTESPSVRSDAARALGRAGADSGSVDLLWGLALDPKTSFQLRSASVSAIMELGVRPEKHVTTLFSLVRSPGLARTTRRSLLRLALSDPVRRTESLALAQEVLGDPKSEPYLREEAAGVIQQRVARVDRGLISRAVQSVWYEAQSRSGWTGRRVIARLVETAGIEPEAADEWISRSLTTGAPEVEQLVLGDRPET
jgi:hypothetical protein